jgi:hypothetical protein
MLKIFRSLRKRHSGESRNPGWLVVGMDTGFYRYAGK